MLTKRSVVSVIILSIITCGIYELYWAYVTLTALQAEGKQTSIPPVLTTLLLLFVSPAGGALLGYDADRNLNLIKAGRGKPTTDNSVLWLILGIFIPIVVAGLAQYEINLLIENQ